ncbi:acyl-ACP desaturase [Mycobacteroides abscessus]|uniref:acyl-ACP desaturase n=8 Tax=Mycobacteroides abscessus TaxID=36809 RepID=UPI00094096F3|nr:acyl-ACP desaturase [Mycobacteroides abscessus]
MQKDFTDLELLYELEPVVEENVHRHLGVTKDWNPHDYVPWSEGKNYKALGGQDWDPEQSKLSEVAKIAMITNLLTEDNLPSYHREIAMNFTMDGPWGTWVNRWTAEENRHGIAIRDYLVVTRSVDPVELEKLRIAQMTSGFSPGQNRQNIPFSDAESLFDSVVYVTFQELATRVSHRNTGKACAEPVADELLKRISTDENLHMIFYRNLVEAGMHIAPDQALKSIHKVLDNFTMPGYTIPGFRRNAVTIATGGVYDPQSHLDEVVMPVLRKWRIFERDDISSEGEWYREDLDRIIGDLKKTSADFEEVKAKYLERQAKRAERQAAKAAREAVSV